MRGVTRGLGFWFLLTFAVSQNVFAESAIAVVKSVSGVLRQTGKDGNTQAVKAADLLNSGLRLESGADGHAMLRLLPDQSGIEIRPHTAIRLRQSRRDGKPIRKLLVEGGDVALNLRRKGDALTCENSQTLIQAKAVRFSFGSDEKGVATTIVLDGELTLINRPKDMTVVVRAGQKAVSDLNGVKVTDASDAELEAVGLRQNTLEVDLHNPETDEVSTLEIEYESHF